MQHKIREQVLDLTISNRLDVFRTQHLAGPFYYRQLLPALEKIFNELSAADEVISIDIIEIDLGIIPFDELESTIWNNEWETVLREQIQIALQDQRKKADPQKNDINNSHCRQWLFYLERGHLDWNTGSFDEKKMQSVLEVLATDYIMVERLRELIRENKNALSRIVNDNAEKFLVNLVEILTAATQQTLKTAVDELEIVVKLLNERSNFSMPSSKQLRQEIWLEIVVKAASGKTGMPAEKLAEAVLLSQKDIPSTLMYMDKMAKVKTIQPVLKKILENKDKESAVPGMAGSKKPTSEEDSLQTDEIDEEGIFVANAGLVLLHPFLATFFKRLELISGGKFLDSIATEKAILLLHYLASGNTSPQEHELVIPKLLCSLPIHIALKGSIEIREDDKQEADDLLLVVIEKWEKLKNVSIDTLRENFLVRPGKLYTKNDTRFLQVEGGSLDVLLDYLPWTLSIMKLPWMKEMVRIEWR